MSATSGVGFDTASNTFHRVLITFPVLTQHTVTTDVFFTVLYSGQAILIDDSFESRVTRGKSLSNFVRDDIRYHVRSSFDRVGLPALYVEC